MEIISFLFFFAQNIRNGFEFFKNVLMIFIAPSVRNPWIFFDQSILKLGVTFQDINIILIGELVLLIVAILRQRYGYARNWLDKQILPFRWIVYLSFFVVVIIYGAYGPGYDASTFIYQGF